MQAPTGEFNFTKLERVIFGPGKVDELGAELDRRGLKRAIVVTGKTLGHSKLMDRLTAALGARFAGVFHGARQHVPESAVRELEDRVEHSEADCLISFGGGSPIDTTKIAIYSLLQHGRELIHIAIPTTLSAGEYTSVAGITDEKTRVKEGVSEPRILPRTVIADPVLTLETPDWLWIGTGMRALDHAIESIYSIRHQPISDALAAKAISLLLEHLPAGLKTAGEEQLAHRGYCQMASWFSIFGSMNTRFGLSHALGHQIGPRWGVPHGITSCITLPHAMRFMAEIAAGRFGPVAEGFGIPFDPANPKPAALECADRTADFIARFDVPRRLRDTGVPHNEVGGIAGPIEKELARSQVVDRPVTQAEIAALLETAY